MPDKLEWSIVLPNLNINTCGHFLMALIDYKTLTPNDISHSDVNRDYRILINYAIIYIKSILDSLD